MNNSLVVKSLIGLATTGAIAGGVTWATWPNGSVDKDEKDETARYQALKESLSIRDGKRVEALIKVFVDAGKDERSQMAKIIAMGNYSDQGALNIFAVNDETGQFFDSGFARTVLGSWCADDSASSNLPKLNKETICNH